MKKTIISLVLIASSALAQAQSDSTNWSFNTDVNFYLIPDDFFVLPVFRADKNKLHLEARYNYEDRETFSGWVGYNFTGGNDNGLDYTITPMVGGVVGNSDGMAAGLEITLTYKSIELYTESENFFDFESRENNYFYNWTDLTYSPTDWLWFGISGQRTRLYQTDLDIQRGILLGAALKNWELSTYCYNIGFDDPFFIVTLSVGF
ncbi:MAG TPA: hypothetical protein VFU05_02835 [Cyclobacteriaceae bacterium]|nr:hypothetical protein [Cyclobacteriaceae bacterium]